MFLFLKESIEAVFAIFYACSSLLFQALESAMCLLRKKLRKGSNAQTQLSALCKKLTLQE